jgi:CheY-like chemotaxis protein
MATRSARGCTASSAAEMVATKASSSSTLVSDISLPGADGDTLGRRLRALEAERGFRIAAIALTARARVRHGEHVAAAGFERHVAKPVSPEELVQAVASVAGRAR